MGSVRAVLEVLKLSSAVDLLQCLSCVCSQWRKLSSHSEVWQTYCEIEDIDLDEWPDKSAKDTYRIGVYPPTTLVFLRNSTVKLIAVHLLPSPAAVTEFSLTCDSGPSDENAYCLISRRRVLRFGVGFNTTVQEIDLRTGTIIELPSMKVARTYPGVFRYSRKEIYLFGGRTKVCEKFHLNSLHWELIRGEMVQSLEALMPAKHGNQVYLAGHTTVEVFDITTETFTELPFHLPVDWWYSLCLIDKEDLVVVQSTKVSRWTITSGKTGFKETLQAHFGSGYYSNCPSVWYNGEHYSLHNDIPDIQGVFAFSPVANSRRVALESL